MFLSSAKGNGYYHCGKHLARQPRFCILQPDLNPIDKFIELYEGKTEFYEQMIKEKNERLQKLLDGKK